jgi:WD40 repeat protein
MFLQFSPDGSELAQACGFAAIEMLETADYRKARTFRPEIDYTPELTGFDYSPDGKTMATARGHSGAQIWDAADPGKPVLPPDGKPLKPFYGVDELYALDKPLHVLQPPTGWSDEFARVNSINYTPDGKLLLTTHLSGHLKIWDTSTWALQRELVVSEKGNSALFSVLAIAPDSKSFIIGDDKGVLHLWSFNSKSEIRAIRSPNGLERIVHLAFSPDGKTLIAIHGGKTLKDGTAVVWNTTDWTAHTVGGRTTAAFSRDGQLLALGGTDIKLFDSGSGKELRTIQVPVFSMAEILSSWDRTDTGEKRPCVVSALAFSPAGDTLAFGCFTTLHIMKLHLGM